MAAIELDINRVDAILTGDEAHCIFIYSKTREESEPIQEAANSGERGTVRIVQKQTERSLYLHSHESLQADLTLKFKFICNKT